MIHKIQYLSGRYQEKEGQAQQNGFQFEWPDLNGGVERAQSAWRYEFYATYDLRHRIDELRAFVDAFAHRYNHYRPHAALGGRTPADYLQALSHGDPPPSHIYWTRTIP